MSQNSEVKADKIINASGEITAGGGGTTLYQIKFLNPGIFNTFEADILDLKFNNLEIGKKYRFTLRCRAQSLNQTDAEMSAVCGGVEIARLQYNPSGGAGEDLILSMSQTVIFEASGTTIVVSGGGPAGTTIFGGNTYQTTFGILEELPGHTVTTQWD